MAIEDYFVPFPLANKLKEKGFNEKCIAFYGRAFPQENFDNLYIQNISSFGGDLCCNAPIHQQVLEWLSSHEIHVIIIYSFKNIWTFQILDDSGNNLYSSSELENFYGRVETLNYAIDMALKFKH